MSNTLGKPQLENEDCVSVYIANAWRRKSYKNSQNTVIYNVVNSFMGTIHCPLMVDGKSK